MTCSCVSSSSSYIPRRYMRIDGLIFDKKYISKLEFDGDILYLYRKGDCCAYKYKMREVKSTAQIAEYLLELNTCSDTQVDMATDDHSKLINLDIEGQHPIQAVNGLQEQLDLKFDKEFAFWKKGTELIEDTKFEYAYTGDVDPNTIILSDGKSIVYHFYLIISNIEEEPELTDDLTLIKNSHVTITTVFNGKSAFMFSGYDFALCGFNDFYYDLQYGKNIKELFNISVIDSLDDTAVDKPLSANQGKVLKQFVDEKQDKIVSTNFDSLPDAINNFGKIYFCNDIHTLVFSDGNKWCKIKLEDF